VSYERIKVERYAGGLGAEVTGVDLSAPYDDTVITEIRAAWHEHLVLFFRNQEITPDDQLAFAGLFGSRMEHLPFIGTLDGYDDIQVTQTNPDWRPQLFIEWHCDVTWKEVPTLGAVLLCIETPAGVGDTLWANMYAAFDALSESMQKFLTGLTGVHDPLKGQQEKMIESQGAEAFAATRKEMPLVEHPLVTVHPETGRRILYVNPLFLSHVKELEREESDALLDYLFRHCEKPEFHCRLRWRKNTIAFWDNRCTMHKVVNDYWPANRKMHRIAIEADDRPRGTNGP
jgi:taurine dioxygenase